MYVSMYVSKYLRKYICMYVCVYVYMHVRIYVRNFVCTYIIYECVCMYVCMNVCVYVCMYICMYIWIYVCTYEICSKKDRTFAIKTLLLILQHFKHCPPQSSSLYWQYTVPNFSSIFGMPPGTHLMWWRAVQLSHFPESPLVFGNYVLSKWF